MDACIWFRKRQSKRQHNMSHWLRLHWLQPSATKMQDILQALATYHHILRMFLRLRLNVLTVHSSPRAGPPLLLRPFMWLSRSWKQINCLKTIRAVASANVFAHAVAPGWVMGACHILKEAKKKLEICFGSNFVSSKISPSCRWALITTVEP